MNKKYSLNAIAVIAMLLCMASCSKWDDFKQYTRDGETLYTGKMDSVVIYPGYLRIRIAGLLPADPKIVKGKIFWKDSGIKDSILFPISKDGRAQLFDTTFKVAEEGIKDFKIQTFDRAGNGSVVVDAPGTVYGPKYESGLLNRPLINISRNEDSVVMQWDVMDVSTGVKGTFITFNTREGGTDTIYCPVDQEKIKIGNYQWGTPLKYKTQYVPDTLAIDTFFSPADSIIVE